MELINKAEVITLIKAKQKSLCPPDRYSRHTVYGEDRVVFDTLNEVLDVVESLPSLDTGWMSVKDNPPDPNVDVLIWFSESKNMAVGSLLFDDLEEQNWSWSTNPGDGWYTDCEGQPTYWMPLPEPPEKERND